MRTEKPRVVLVRPSSLKSDFFFPLFFFGLTSQRRGWRGGRTVRGTGGQARSGPLSRDGWPLICGSAVGTCSEQGQVRGTRRRGPCAYGVRPRRRSPRSANKAPTPLAPVHVPTRTESQSAAVVSLRSCGRVTGQARCSLAGRNRPQSEPQKRAGRPWRALRVETVSCRQRSFVGWGGPRCCQSALLLLAVCSAAQLSQLLQS